VTYLWGNFEFVKVMRDNGCKADVTVAEAETFIYASRSDGPAQARIFRIKEAVPLAALPATRTRGVLDAICEAYPQFIDGVDVLNTGMNNMGAIFHPALTLLNMGWIEATHGDYQFYIAKFTHAAHVCWNDRARDRGIFARHPCVLRMAETASTPAV
jgi:opine dehydrogenase